MDRYVNFHLVLHSCRLAFEQFNLGVVLFGLKLAICPFTRYDIIVVVLWPFLVGANHPVEKIFFVTSMAQPSVHPQFAIITLFEGAICDKLVTGLVDATLYGVRLEQESLDPDATLLHLPANLIDDGHVNADNVIQVFREEVSGPTIQQLTLASILHSRRGNTDIITDAPTDWFCNMEIDRNR